MRPTKRPPRPVHCRNVDLKTWDEKLSEVRDAVARRGKVKSPPKYDGDPWIGTAHVSNLIAGAKT
jgi:hypothetical protein